MTRCALLISGEPRFCRELDQLLDKFTNFDQIDWYVLVWDRSPQVSDYHRSQQSRLVADSWLAPTQAWAEAKIRENLPAKHTLARLELVDQQTLNFGLPPHHDGVTNIANAWKMFWCNQQTDLWRQAAEQAQGFNYDLVIKARPDMLAYSNIDLASAAEISKNPGCIIMPDNTRAGYGYAVSDLMALGGSKAMAQYADCINSVNEYIEHGGIFHPETILGWYLRKTNMSIQTMGIRIDIRQLGQRLSETAYISDFGRWA